MAGPTTEVLNEDLKTLKDEVHRIAVGLAELKTEVRILSGIAKWGVGLLVTIVLMGLSGIGTALWWGSGIDARVKQVEVKAAQSAPGVHQAVHEEIKATAKDQGNPNR